VKQRVDALGSRRAKRTETFLLTAPEIWGTIRGRYNHPMPPVFSYPPVSEQRCQNCYCSRQHDTILRCHADVPKCSTSNLERAAWPIVCAGDWCGAWSRKEENEQ